MAKLIPALILFFFLSSCNAGSPIASSENEANSLPVTNFSEEDVSDLKPLILLPTDTQFNSDPIPLVNGEKNDIPAIGSIGNGVKKLDWGPMNPRFGRMRSIRCRHRRFGGDGQIRPREMPFLQDEEFHHHHHYHHHGEMFDGARFHEVSGGPGVEGDGRMIGEFKQPKFFFRRHHHHHHHHHDDEDEEFHHRGEEEEMEHHHRHRRGFWRRIRKVLAHF